MADNKGYEYKMKPSESGLSMHLCRRLGKNAPWEVYQTVVLETEPGKRDMQLARLETIIDEQNGH